MVKVGVMLVYKRGTRIQSINSWIVPWFDYETFAQFGHRLWLVQWSCLVVVV